MVTGGRAWIVVSSTELLSSINFSISTLDYLLDVIAGFHIFTKIDIHNGYYPICIHESNERKIIFNIKDGLYEWLILVLLKLLFMAS